MWARPWLLTLLASCYSPHPSAGGPCSSALTCPGDLTCALVDGERICVDTMPIDAAVTMTDGAVHDDSAVSDAPSVGLWSLLQTRSAMGISTQMSASGAGHLIVVAVQTDNMGAATSVTDNASNVYLPIAGSRGTNAGEDLAIELWYATSSLAGATTISASAPKVWALAVWEVAGTSTSNPLDTVASLSNQPQTNAPVGASITTTAAGEFVVSVAIVANVVSGLSSGSVFTGDHTTYGNGWAHLTSKTAPAGTYQAQWNQPNSGSFCATSAAFVTAAPN